MNRDNLIYMLDEQYNVAMREHIRLSPPQGTIAVGSAHMDPFFLAEGIRGALNAIRRGDSVLFAYERGCAVSTEAVRIHNRRVEYQRQRAENTAHSRLFGLLLPYLNQGHSHAKKETHQESNGI